MKKSIAFTLIAFVAIGFWALIHFDKNIQNFLSTEEGLYPLVISSGAIIGIIIVVIIGCNIREDTTASILSTYNRSLTTSDSTQSSIAIDSSQSSSPAGDALAISLMTDGHLGLNLGGVSLDLSDGSLGVNIGGGISFNGFDSTS